MYMYTIYQLLSISIYHLFIITFTCRLSFVIYLFMCWDITGVEYVLTMKGKYYPTFSHTWCTLKQKRWLCSLPNIKVRWGLDIKVKWGLDIKVQWGLDIKVQWGLNIKVQWRLDIKAQWGYFVWAFTTVLLPQLLTLKSLRTFKNLWELLA